VPIADDVCNGTATSVALAVTLAQRFTEDPMTTLNSSDQPVASEDQTRSVRSFCRNCAALCGIYVDVVDGQVVRIRGDADHALSHGYTCSKGRALGAAHIDSRRLDRPAMRRDGQLVDVSWDACLDDLASGVRDVVDRYGPDAVAFFIGSGGYYDTAGYMAARGLFRAMKSRSLYTDMSLDTAPKILASELVGGFPTFFPRIDTEQATMSIYIGANKVVSHGQISMLADPVTTLRDMTRRGEVWVIDPRRTETANLATRHLAPLPGTDYAILAFITRELLTTVDRVALATRAVGIDELASAVEPFDIAHTAQLCGLAESELADLLAAICRAGRIAIETGTGVSMSPPATVTEWLTWAVLIVTDSVDRPGGVWCHPGFFRPLDGASMPFSPIDAPRSAGPASRPDLHALVGELPAAALCDEIEAGNIRAVINVGANLVTCLPGTADTMRALAKLDVFACLEISATATTALATHVLPTTSQLERADLTHMDWLFASVATQYTPAVVAPSAERRAMWRVLVDLGERLGRSALRGVTLDNSDDDVLTGFLGQARASFDELHDAGLVTAFGAATDWLDRYVERLGGWRLAPAPLVARLAELRPASEGLVLVCRRQAKHLNSQFDRLGDHPSLFVNPDDAARINASNGQSVRIATEHGSVLAQVEVDSTLRRGTVAMGHGWEHANVNNLTSGRYVDPLSGMPVFSAFKVDVTPLAD
jgi:anaerobic selenocysteine-containing dehydrogenase